MWKLKTNTYVTSKQCANESLYMVGNGYLGVRGCFEEGYPDGDTIRGTYINGLYDRVPMVHAEMAYGFPTEQDKQPRLVDTQTCEVWLDGERASMISGRYEAYERTLDFHLGETIRTYKYKTELGKVATLTFKRMASFYQKNTLIYSVKVIYDGVIKLVSVCNTEVENYANRKDPRTGQGHTLLMQLKNIQIMDHQVLVLMQTRSTGIEQALAIGHYTDAPAMFHEQANGKVYTFVEGQSVLYFEKHCVFTDGLRSENPMADAREILTANASTTYFDFLKHQKKYLDDYWDFAGIEIEGSDPDQNAIRFMQFQLLQSVGGDLFSNVAAKGLSGEGYEGHYFWDTEIYVLPLLTLNQPEMAKQLLAYRAHILPFAKVRALELGQTKGAAYAWRTISGIECSGYFPAGTAQYHINADIAYAFIQYHLYTDDWTFLVEKGAEVIFETARLWLDMGHYDQGMFHIYNVTGPDEYTAIVNDNYYTNVMAKYHLHWAHKFYHLLKALQDETLKEIVADLFTRINLTDDEVEAMLSASDAMALPYDAERDMYAQDAAFLSKPIWPETFNKRPLLLHYHPLQIYRHQILKQADTVLAHMLLESYATEDQIKNAYLYYEKLTTHDSSLSSCIYGIMASRCGFNEKAFDYFLESINLDLEDTHKNTKDGLHMANMAGTVLSVLTGFAGLRMDASGVSLKPRKPSGWTRFSFKIRVKGRVIKVIIDDAVQLQLLEGAPITIKVWDEERHLVLEERKHKAVIFDLDGVLTETSKAHFEAWKTLGLILGFDVPLSLIDEVRGISRMESLEKVLKYDPQKRLFTETEKNRLAEEKNNIYLEKIKAYGPEELTTGAIELLESIKKKGLKIGLASASNNAPYLLSAMGIEHYFDVIVDPKTLKRGKPDPEIFVSACEALALNPEVCIGVEDAYAGIESIIAGGLLPLGIGDAALLSNCRYVFRTLNELKTHLLTHLI